MGLKMNKLLLSTAMALLASVGVASAADLPMKAPPAPVAATPMWDVAFGGALMTDYNFRGISQSDRRPSLTAYIEPRYNWSSAVQLYVGVQGWATKLPTQPTGEFDLYGGIRITLGAFAFDLGALYYYYPGEVQQFFSDPTLTAVSSRDFGFGIFTLRNTDFLEFYGKVTYTFNDYVAIGGQIYYSDNYLNTGASGTFLNGNVKLTAPSTWLPTGIGGYVSGDVGHYWFGDSADSFNPPVRLSNFDYTTWDAGVGFTYKIFTLDVRYYDTDLTKAECFGLTGDPRGLQNGQSRWCGESIVAKLSFDMTLNANVK
jgi:uncharacterized protein (TIGR02001 family)